MIKNKCLKNNINMIDAGPNGVVIGFKNNYFKETEKLLQLVSNSSGKLKIRPDQKIFFQKKLNGNEEKIDASLLFIDQLESL